MFKKLFLLSALVVGLLGTNNMVSAQSNKNDGLSRSNLERQVRKEILTLPYYGVFDAIGYQINGNTVMLSGFVVRSSTKNDAERYVKEINGVGNVINNIEVLPPSPSDDRIRRETLRTFFNRGGSLYRYFLGANPPIRIIVNRGRIQLEGYVDNKGDYNLANILARGVSGTFGVTNNLKIGGESR